MAFPKRLLQCAKELEHTVLCQLNPTIHTETKTLSVMYVIYLYSSFSFWFSTYEISVKQNFTSCCSGDYGFIPQIMSERQSVRFPALLIICWGA
jgi:hypothetical protein